MRYLTPLGAALYPALYPILGIWFFITHPPFWSLFKTRLIPVLFLSLLVYTLLFMFAFLPQAALLAIFHGPAAFVSAAFLVLGEGAVIVALLFEAFFVDETLVDVFDATLLSRHQDALLSPSRTIFPAASNPVKALGPPTEKAVYGPFSFRQIAEFVLFLPLNFIPFVGVPLFLVLTGRRAGPLQHWRYFKLRGLGRKERNKEVESRRWGYTWFGTIALLLQLVPVLSMFFLLTSAAGSALWVADLEEKRQQQLLAAEGVVGGAEVNDEFPPEYTDTEDQVSTLLVPKSSKMHLLVYLGFFLALCGISSAAPAGPVALLQDGHLDKHCSVTTIYVTVTDDPSLPDVRTFGNVTHYSVITNLSITITRGTSPNLDQTLTPHGDVAALGELTTTITRTEIGGTFTITIDNSGVTRSDTIFTESASVRFLHDGLAATAKPPATLTTTFQPLIETGGPKVSETVNTTSQPVAVATETLLSESIMTDNTLSQSLTAATGTAATGGPVTDNTTSQFLTAPTGTEVSMVPPMVNTSSQSLEAPTETQSDSGDNDVVVKTVTVYPIESVASETSSNNPLPTSDGPPTPHDPEPASLFSTSNETVPTQTVGIQTNVTNPLAGKDALGAISFVVTTPILPPFTSITPRADARAALVSSGTSSTITLALPFIGTIVLPFDVNGGTTQASRTSLPSHIPGLWKARLVNPTPDLGIPITTEPTDPLATAAPSPRNEDPSCGEQGIFRLNFDEIQPQSMSGPYHHFYFSQGFVVASPPNAIYAAASGPHLLEFTQTDVDVTRNHNAPPTGDGVTTGEIGIGTNLQWGCYAFNALSASVGCNSAGPRCDWQFTGVQWDYGTQKYNEVITQHVSTAGCPGLKDCKLADVVLLDEFEGLQALRVNVTVAGRPKKWWTDDLKLEWADGKCDAGLCRAMHR
ncbi:hypothetical protein V495_02241 [Pseudogymnoascus sp. VKM F-4514 (FW-929)]|nr:hypothetical protein V495_02241 [Pseudogymnoascus sp. VKM F-4514 (FW-929)]KFY60737.1 hypothetical protein V497_03414 [Pseudogymnoascus sp. VKM F-4516 (FW-969)]